MSTYYCETQPLFKPGLTLTVVKSSPQLTDPQISFEQSTITFKAWEPQSFIPGDIIYILSESVLTQYRVVWGVSCC